MRNDSLPLLRPHLRPVRDVETPLLQFRTIHGYRHAFRVAGSGPALLLIHGVGDNSTAWEPVHAKLAQRFTVIAPDVLGHGESDKPRADYSLAAFANGMRDLLAVLGIDRVTVVGHSFGGGVAMQFAYQYPQLVERIVLVSTGGVAEDVSFALRLAALPMGSEALAMLRMPGARAAMRLFGRAVETVLGSTKYGRDAADVVGLLEDLQEPSSLSAFARTLRSVVDGRGQLVTMLDRIHLVQPIPVQLIWGDEDLVIPVSHARMAHAALRGSRLEMTRPADYDQDLLRSLLRTGIHQDTAPGSLAAASDSAKSAVS